MEKEEGRMPKPGEIKPEIQRRKEGVGLQHEMESQPISTKIAQEMQQVDEAPTLASYKAAGKLEGRKALITGGDSGIGRSVALFYAKEGADVAIGYLPVEQKDAEDTRKLIEQENLPVKCSLIPMDIQSEENCQKLVQKTIDELGGLDLLVSNAAYQMCCQDITELSAEQLEKTFKTNIFAAIYLAKHSVPHMKSGSSIIFSTSVVAFKGNPKLVDYVCTKSALVGLTRSLAIQLAPKGIRVNAVAPGPVWTPLQPISRSQENMEHFTKKKPLVGRIGQPSEIAPSYVFLASGEGSQYTGQVLHPNGGYIVGS